MWNPIRLRPIDSCPAALELLPSIAHPGDLNGQDVVIEQLTETGVIADGHVHPIVERWLQTLDRPMWNWPR